MLGTGRQCLLSRQVLADPALPSHSARNTPLALCHDFPSAFHPPAWPLRGGNVAPYRAAAILGASKRAERVNETTPGAIHRDQLEAGASDRHTASTGRA